MMACKDCEYYVKEDGCCHINAPIAGSMGAVWPCVKWTDWCGKFESLGD